jgi:hypothetical protein
MSTKVVRVVTSQVLVSILLLALVLPAMVLASSGEVMTNENIVALLRWQAKPQEIVALIERNPTRFDLSAESLSELRLAGVSPEVLDAMWKATVRASSVAEPVSAPQPPSTARELGARGTAGSGTKTRKPKNDPPDPASDPPQNSCKQVGANAKPHTADRFDQANRALDDLDNNRLPQAPKYDENCPLGDSESSKHNAKNGPRHDVDLDWVSGSVAPSRVDHGGEYCFALHNVNNILYSYGFTVNRIEPQGSDLDLLKDAIAKLKDLPTGAAQEAKIAQDAKTKALNLAPELLSCNAENFDKAVDKVREGAAALQDVLSQLEPGKDASGKPKSVSLEATRSKWQSVPAKFDAFEKAIKDLHPQFKNDCGACPLAQAEALVLDVYLPARTSYLALKARAESQNIARYTTSLENTNAYDVVVKEYYGGQQTTADAKTFHLDPGRQILVSSAGFLLTQLQARSYLSRTVPDPADATKTQNVLGVDGGGKPRPALVALLNYNLPWQPWRNVGFAISAGPVFDIANGKADTSHFGFFGGASVHLWNRLFLTPGVHVGEFADFPQGFNKPGDIIPDKTGTPSPVKRYTARFAFAITFKVSGLSFGSGGSTPDAKPASSQPKPATP